MAPSAALYLAILLLAGNCAHAAGGEPPGQELEWMPGCKEAAEAQLAEMQAGVPQARGLSRVGLYRWRAV